MKKLKNLLFEQTEESTLLAVIDSNKEVTKLIKQAKRIMKQNIVEYVKEEIRKDPKKKEYLTVDWVADYFSQWLMNADRGESNLISLILIDMVNGGEI